MKAASHERSTGYRDRREATLPSAIVGVGRNSLHDEGIDQLTLPSTTLAVVVVLAGVAGVIAAIVPARRAARLDVLRAVVTDQQQF